MNSNNDDWFNTDSLTENPNSNNNSVTDDNGSDFVMQLGVSDEHKR